MKDNFIELFTSENGTGKQILDSLPTAVYITDAEGNLKYFNPAAAKLNGRTPNLDTDRWCVSWKLYYPDGTFMPHKESALAISVKEERSVDGMEGIVERPDGERKWFRAYASPLRNEEDEVIGGINIIADIDELKKIQEEREQLLREAKAEQELLLDIFQNAPSFMAIMRGPDHVIERGNELFLQLIGEREFTDKPFREAIPEGIEQGFIECLDHVYETGKSYRENQMPVMLYSDPEMNQAEERYLDFIFQPIIEADESITGVFLQGVDQTERMKAWEELEAINESLEKRVEERTESLLSYQEQLRSLAFQLSRSEEEQRQQLATELHDNLGQLLSVGKMKIDLLQQDQLSGQNLQDINELEDVIDDAITYTRELMLDLKPPSSIGENLEESISWMAEKLEKHGLEVTVKDDGNPKPLNEEVKSTVLQCVRELLFNVIKHTNEDEAKVSARCHNDEVFITVEDKGEGFDQDNVSPIPDEKGRFGLFNVKERIDLLGGKVEITSVPGKGTEVTLQIPLEEKPEGTELKKVTKSRKGNGVTKAQNRKQDKISVMLADDHEMVRKGLRKIIEEQEDIIVVAEAANGEEAIKLARQNSPDVILMDVSMPETDGIEATRQIVESMPNTSIVGLSLHEEEQIIEKMRSAGASAFLPKTDAFESLIVTIRAEASAMKK